MTLDSKRIAIVLLGNGGATTAKKIQMQYPDAKIFGFENRVDSADSFYDNFGATLRELYQSDTAIIALCAAGIVIRTLAPLLAQKNTEPPVLAVAEDGSAVVPLLGGLGGVNILAREISAVLGISATITTSGELRFGQCLLNPPAGYAVADIEQGKRFVSDLLGGATVRIDGEAPWLTGAHLPLDNAAQRSIKISRAAIAVDPNQLLIHPRAVIVLIHSPPENTADTIARALADADIAPLALACLVATTADMANGQLQQIAMALNVPLRFADDLQRGASSYFENG